MLIDFSVENFKSFRDRKTFSMVASKRLKDERPEHYYELPDYKLKILRLGALYGANAAGKSNLIQAMDISQAIIKKFLSRDERFPYHPFKLDKESLSKPTYYEYRIFSNGKVFAYSFSHDAERVHEESLYFFKGQRAVNIYQRAQTADGKERIHFGGTFPATETVKALAKVLNRNQLFLTSLMNLDDAKALDEMSLAVAEWFNKKMFMLFAQDQQTQSAVQLTDEKFALFAGEFLRLTDTGIQALGIQQRRIPRRSVSASGTVSDAAFAYRTAEEDWHNVEAGKTVRTTGSTMQRRAVAIHKIRESGEEVAFALEEESDGLRRLIELLRGLFRLNASGGLFVVDEINQSMHPMMVVKYIEYFLAGCKADDRQLLFATHEASLLDLKRNVLLRDEIWFADKDRKGVTDLYPLTDFPVRKDLRIDVGYFQGRFGGTPFLRKIERMIDQTNTNALE